MYDDEIRRLNEVGGNRAAATRACVDRYFFIVDNAKESLKSKMTELELDAIADLFQSFWFFERDLATIPNGFHHIICSQLLARGEDFEIVDALRKKLEALSIDEKFSLIDEAEIREARRSRSS
jgi:hypothetical protein